MSEHIPISPAILYWGTPVCLISTTNPDGTANIGPMSSIFWLGHSCMIGLELPSQTTQNILRNGLCTLNLPSDDMKDAVNALARTTGTDPCPPGKVARGYSFVKDKFAAADLTPIASETVTAPGIKECPVVMEASHTATHSLFAGTPFAGSVLVFEMKILNTKIHPHLKLAGHANRIDSDRWKPMIMMFSELYGLRDGKLRESELARIDEEMYRGLTGTKVDPVTGSPVEGESEWAS